MDTQAKLQLITDYEQRFISLYSQKEWEKALFSISEYGNRKLIFHSDHLDQQLWVECIHEEGGVWLEPGIPFDFTEQRVPGDFKLIWKLNEKKMYHGHFTITPHSMEGQTLTQMCACIEQKIYGLTRDWYSSKQGQRSEDDQWLLHVFSQHYEELIHALTYIERYPIEQLTRVRERNQVSKSLNYDVKENHYLKYLLQELIVHLNQLRLQQQLFQHQLQAQRHQITQHIEQIQQAKAQIQDPRNFTTQLYDLDKKLRIRYSELTHCEQQLVVITQRFRPITELYVKITRLLNESWLQPLPTLYKGSCARSLLRRRGYMQIGFFVQKINQRDAKTLSFPRHHTSKLFEYYAVLLMQDILESRGFENHKGVLTSTLETEEKMKFTHPTGETILLSYDGMINDLTTARQQKEAQLVSITGGSRRPDILLEHFDASGAFKKAFIVEVKYRRLKHIYQGEVDTDVINQLNNYSCFKYYQPDTRLNRGSDVDVVVIYPEYYGSKHIKDEILGYEFIPLLPIHFNLEDEQFHPLLSLIDHFLNVS